MGNVKGLSVSKVVVQCTMQATVAPRQTHKKELIGLRPLGCSDIKWRRHIGRMTKVMQMDSPLSLHLGNQTPSSFENYKKKQPSMRQWRR